MDDILKSTSSNTEQVIIEPDGRWAKSGGEESARQSTKLQQSAYTNDDDDLVEVRDTRVTSLRHEQKGANSSAQTPPLSSREDSIASSVPTSQKRPASAVIDLTLDDEDETPPSKIKRPSFGPGVDTARPQFGHPISFGLSRPSLSSQYNPD